jgi:hypothetical protein
MGTPSLLVALDYLVLLNELKPAACRSRGMATESS